MRRATLYSSLVLATSLGVAACATVGAPVPRTAEAQQQLNKLLAGRTAGKPQSCLPSFRAQDMVVVDENTILYRDGSKRVWRNDMNGPCNGLGRPGTALVTRVFGGSGTCRGDIAQVVDTSLGFTSGSCSFGDFVPYTGPQAA